VPEQPGRWLWHNRNSSEASKSYLLNLATSTDRVVKTEDVKELSEEECATPYENNLSSGHRQGYYNNKFLRITHFDKFKI
jgi:hypothetical protein